jgi:hypothetical protein
MKYGYYYTLILLKIKSPIYPNFLNKEKESRF